jgi:TolA-binding protein
MKRTALMVVAVLTLGSMVWADGAAAPVQDLSAYLDQLQLKLDHTAQRANQPNSSGSSVVGLRGSKQEPVSKQLYWKGKSGPTPVTPEEVKMFRSAIEQAKAGQKDTAIATLKSFAEKYPKSGLLGDAKDTLNLLTAGTPAVASSPMKS